MEQTYKNARMRKFEQTPSLPFTAMPKATNPFPRLSENGFDVAFTFHADAILALHFQGVIEEIGEAVGGVEIPIVEIIAGGGGEAKVTQRLRRRLQSRGWRKRNFAVEKRINARVTYASSHEVDHVKNFAAGMVALEIEWNNKDPFFDRDLENFHRLHADGAISFGVIVTRGQSLQDEIENPIKQYASVQAINEKADLERLGITRTERQLGAIARAMRRRGVSFADAWAATFKADKFGAATTHWAKLKDRLDRGVGSPCPLVAIGIPIDRVRMGTPGGNHPHGGAGTL